jgi:hypothetical protein
MQLQSNAQLRIPVENPIFCYLKTIALLPLKINQKMIFTFLQRFLDGYLGAVVEISIEKRIRNPP